MPFVALSPSLALILALVGAAAMVDYHEALFMPRVLEVQRERGLGKGYSFGRDFYQIWITAQEWFGQGLDPYSAEMTREIQVGLYGRPVDPSRPTDPVDARRFPYPLFTDLLFWPTTTIAFPQICVAVVCTLGALTVASAILWLRGLGISAGWKWTAVAMLLTVSSYPALEGLYSAQIGLLVTFMLAAAAFAAARGRYLFSGMLLALTTMKPQVTALAILFLLLWSIHEWRIRRGLLLGFAGTEAVLAGAAFIAQPHWMALWLGNMEAYHHYTAAPLVTQVVTSPLGERLSGPATWVLTAMALIVAIGLAWRHRAARVDSFEFRMTLALLLALTTIVLLPGQAVYDHLILLPGIFLMAQDRLTFRNAGRIPRLLWGVTGVLLLWPWAVSLVFFLMRPALRSVAFQSSNILALPLRTSASLPFAVLALLCLRWRISVPMRADASVPLSASPEGA